jgi:hypothetical protein
MGLFGCKKRRRRCYFNIGFYAVVLISFSCCRVSRTTVHALALTRTAFLEHSSAATGSVLLSAWKSDDDGNDDLILPLQRLALGGCLVARITLISDDDYNTNSYNYYCTVDTGSPFLTVPTLACTKPTRNPTTKEQYGEAVGDMTWRTAPRVILTTIDGTAKQFKNVLVGVPPANVIRETGGLFLGLLLKDDGHASFLQQTKYTSFVLDWRRNELLLSKNGLHLPKHHSSALPLLDLNAYGPDLYHYSVLANALSIRTNNNNDHQSICLRETMRPIVVVLDSGLTGCILSDSFKDERPFSLIQLDEIQGITIHLANNDSISLSSRHEFWNLSCFKLPWFHELDNDYPHVIVAGATFFADTRLSVDTVSREVLIETMMMTK